MPDNDNDGGDWRVWLERNVRLGGWRDAPNLFITIAPAEWRFPRLYFLGAPDNDNDDAPDAAAEAAGEEGGQARPESG